MAVWLVPIDHAAAVLRVDLHVRGATHCTAVFDAGRLDALENRIKFFRIDTEAEVLDGKRSIVIDEIESQSVIDEYRREWSSTDSAQRTPSRSARRLAETT
jgi:Mg-chelatase subunit ChlI